MAARRELLSRRAVKPLTFRIEAELNPRLHLLAPLLIALCPPVLRAAAPNDIPVEARAEGGTAEEIKAPDFVPGESWRFTELEGYSRLELRTWRVEVVSSNRGETRFSVAGGRPGAEDAREARIYSAAGVLETGRLNDAVFGSFRPGLQLLSFPLAEGKTWSQSVRRTDPSTGTERTVTLRGKVIGWETVKVPAGEFRALKVERAMTLGNHGTFRTETRRVEYEWYVPELKSAARIEIWEEYFDPTVPRILRYLLRDKRYLDLVSFEPRPS